MAGSVSGLNTFATQSGPIPLAQLDSNISALTTAINNLANFDNYYVDSGAVNAIAVTVSSPQIVAYTAGLMLQVKVASTNTGATTININGLGNVAVVTPNGSAVSAGALVSGGIYQFQYDGTSFQLQTPTVKSPFYAAKASNTARASTATLSNDPDLVYAISAAGTYRIDAYLYLTYGLATSPAGGFSLNLNYGGSFVSGAGGSSFVLAGGTATQGAGYLIQSTQTTSALSYNPGLSPNTYASIFTLSGVLIATGTGTFGLSWAQASSSTTATTLYAGSYLAVTRLT